VSARLLLIDNYDSFTYNLVQAFLVLGADVQVYRNDAITIDEARALQPTHLCISPGPGTPQHAGRLDGDDARLRRQIPVFGVCLGHQSIVEVFGGKVVRAGRLMHGKTSLISR
jgi:anthranilate synthase/aminodeoxychorismate synthase-like glutamine amidotransferase